METIKDLVSVIIPTYNRANLIKRSAMSVLNQTYSNLELIIVDDGSTDNTEEVVKSIDDNRVIYIKQSNQGACAARNNGIDHAQGEFIAFQDSDDVWHEDKLEKQLKCLKETGADMVVCKYNIVINDTIRRINSFHLEGFIDKGTPPFCIGTQSFFAKAFVFSIVKFDTQMPRYQDFEILLRIHRNYSIYYLQESLVDYCIQNDSISQNAAKLIAAWNKILTKNEHFKDDFHKYNKQIASFIFRDAVLEDNEFYQNNLICLAFYFDHSLCIKLQYFLFKIHLYKFIRFWRNLFVHRRIA